MEQVHSAKDLCHPFSFRKIIPKPVKISQSLKFYNNNNKLFQNYILAASIILHLGPYITFYNYD
jgi:hypothetical protein